MQKLISETSSYNKLPPTWPPIKKSFWVSGINCFATEEELNFCRSRIESDNRNGKIESILENKEFFEKKIDEDEEYKKLKNKGQIKILPTYLFPTHGMGYWLLFSSKVLNKFPRYFNL